MPLGVSLALVAFFLFMNAFFVVAEFSMVRVRASQLEVAQNNGQPGAKAAYTISQNVNAYLSACQLGITLASLALGWLGEPAVAALVSPFFSIMGLPEKLVHPISLGIAFVLVTALHIIVGELIPKSLAIFDTQTYARITAVPLIVFYRITYPIMVVFNFVTNSFVRALGHNPKDEREIYTTEEIRLLIDESTEGGLIDADQNEFVDNIFDIADKTVGSIMTPRPDMITLSLEDSLGECIKTSQLYSYSRYPVQRANKDDIVGFVHISDIYRAAFEHGMDESLDIVDAYDIPAVPESMPVVRLLEFLKSQHVKMSVVVDEHGGTAGMVTVGDVFEDIVGDMEDERAHTSCNISPVEGVENEYIIFGSCPLEDFFETIGIHDGERLKEFDTVGGLLMEAFDAIPDVGDVISIDIDNVQIRATVRSMDGLRIGKVLVFVELHE